MIFHSLQNHVNMFAWYKLSPEAIANIAKIYGFEKSTVTHHVQYQNNIPTDFYTVVCERTVPIEKCSY